jgi:hypothetical protein
MFVPCIAGLSIKTNIVHWTSLIQSDPKKCIHILTWKIIKSVYTFWATLYMFIDMRLLHVSAPTCQPQEASLSLWVTWKLGQLCGASKMYKKSVWDVHNVKKNKSRPEYTISEKHGETESDVIDFVSPCYSLLVYSGCDSLRFTLCTSHTLFLYILEALHSCLSFHVTHKDKDAPWRWHVGAETCRSRIAINIHWRNPVHSVGFYT